MSKIPKKSPSAPAFIATPAFMSTHPSTSAEAAFVPLVLTLAFALASRPRLRVADVSRSRKTDAEDPNAETPTLS